MSKSFSVPAVKNLVIKFVLNSSNSKDILFSLCKYLSKLSVLISIFHNPSIGHFAFSSVLYNLPDSPSFITSKTEVYLGLTFLFTKNVSISSKCFLYSIVTVSSLGLIKIVSSVSWFPCKKLPSTSIVIYPLLIVSYGIKSTIIYSFSL